MKGSLLEFRSTAKPTNTGGLFVVVSTAPSGGSNTQPMANGGGTAAPQANSGGGPPNGGSPPASGPPASGPPASGPPSGGGPPGKRILQ